MATESSAFAGILVRYFEGFLASNPAYAASAGIKSGEGKLGEATLEFERRQARRRQKALQALETISPRELSNEQQLDRLALRSLLLREEEDFARQRHALDPNAPEQLFNILLHELQRGENEPARAARNLRSLLREIPRYLNEAATLLDRLERVWLKVMEQTTAGAETLFQAVAVFLKRTGPRPNDAGEIKAARQSLEVYRTRAEQRPLAAESSFKVGAATLQRRVLDQLGLDYTLGQIEALALSEVRRICELLNGATAKFGRRQSAEKIIGAARARWQPEKPLLELYREQTERIAQAFRAANAVSFPSGDRLEVRPVPDFMRPLFPTAAYSAPGAFERRQRGVFWVNDLSLIKTAPAERLAEQQQHFGLSLTCAHEAYPGHHLQFVTANRHPRKWRRLFAHAVFYEGWTLWCEQMMVDLKIERSPWLRVQQLHDALWRCHRILVDLRLQTGRYNYEQAVKHMQRHLGFTRARAEADVNWYTGQPTVPMSYWLGRLENERLRRRLMQGRGWSLRKFNDWLLSFGTLPQAWIEKYGLD